MVGDEEEEDAIESMLLPDLSETEPYLSYEELQGLDAPVYSGKVSKDRYLEPEYLLPELAGQAPSSELSGLQLNEELEKGVLTGGAAKINRINEDFLAKQNNDDFFEYERNKKSSALMKVNGNMNNNRPDAKLFMDIALVRPQNVPSCKDYQFVSSEKVKELNEKYNLHGNKKINSWYDGFEFSKDSPTAQRINSSEEK